VGTAKVFLGSDEDAVTWYRRSIEINRNYPIAHSHLAAALAYLGKIDDAQAEAKLALILDRDFSISRYRAGAYGGNSLYLAQRERLIEGMRRAGLPER
jgi:tetratricopeptide (TPR) repeat protein